MATEPTRRGMPRISDEPFRQTPEARRTAAREKLARPAAEEIGRNLIRMAVHGEAFDAAEQLARIAAEPPVTREAPPDGYPLADEPAEGTGQPMPPKQAVPEGHPDRAYASTDKSAQTTEEEQQLRDLGWSDPAIESMSERQIELILQRGTKNPRPVGPSTMPEQELPLAASRKAQGQVESGNCTECGAEFSYDHPGTPTEGGTTLCSDCMYGWLDEDEKAGRLAQQNPIEPVTSEPGSPGQQPGQVPSAHPARTKEVWDDSKFSREVEAESPEDLLTLHERLNEIGLTRSPDQQPAQQQAQAPQQQPQPVQARRAQFSEWEDENGDGGDACPLCDASRPEWSPGTGTCSSCGYDAEAMAGVDESVGGDPLFDELSEYASTEGPEKGDEFAYNPKRKTPSGAPPADASVETGVGTPGPVGASRKARRHIALLVRDAPSGQGDSEGYQYGAQQWIRKPEAEMVEQQFRSGGAVDVETKPDPRGNSDVWVTGWFNSEKVALDMVRQASRRAQNNGDDDASLYPCDKCGDEAGTNPTPGGGHVCSRCKDEDRRETQERFDLPFEASLGMRQIIAQPKSDIPLGGPVTQEETPSGEETFEDSVEGNTKQAADKMKVECLECGKVFKTSSPEPKCPKCGGYDIDIAKDGSRQADSYKDFVKDKTEEEGIDHPFDQHDEGIKDFWNEVSEEWEGKKKESGKKTAQPIDQPPAAAGMQFEKSNVRSDGDRILWDVSWEPEDFSTMSEEDVRQQIRSWVQRDVSNEKDTGQPGTKNWGTVADITTEEFDGDAGIATVSMLSSEQSAPQFSSAEATE